MFHYFLLLFSCLVLTSCQPTEEKEQLEKLTEETQEPYPAVRKETKELQQEVKKLNQEVERESQNRIDKIQKQLGENKQAEQDRFSRGNLK